MPSVFSSVDSCTASSNVKESWFKNKRYLRLVLCVGLFFESCLCFGNHFRSSASYTCNRERDNKIVMMLRVNRRVSLQFYVGYRGQPGAA